MSADAEFAWAVGLFEGEGSIIHSKAGTGYKARKLMLDSTDRDVVERSLRGERRVAAVAC